MVYFSPTLYTHAYYFTAPPILISTHIRCHQLLRHGLVVIKVLFFLFTAKFSAAERPPSPAPPFFEPLPTQPKFNPSLALLMLIIVGAFFSMGFFSIYIRRCAERTYMRRNVSNDGAVLTGGGRISGRGPQGLDAAVIGTFPTFPYSTVKGHKIGKGSLECAVCLNEFEDDQTLRLMPRCSHVFHPDCIDAWLASHTTCPVCRADLVPKPGDITFDSDTIFQPDNIDNTAQSDFSIRISDENDQTRGIEPVNAPAESAPNRPSRSWSTGWRIGNLFLKSRSTDHLLVQPGENTDRFTLRLPEEIRNQLLNTHLNRAKSCVAFPRATSTKRGYRSRSGGNWRGKNYYYYERLDKESHPADWMAIPMNPLKSGLVRSSNNGVKNNANPQKNMLLKSVKSSVQYRINGVDRNSSKNDTGEASFDQLRTDDPAASRGSELA